MCDETTLAEGWLNIRTGGDAFYTNYIDAAHIGIYERPKRETDAARIIKVFPATDDYIQKAEEFCGWARKHYEDIDPMSFKNCQKRLAAMMSNTNK